LMDDDISEGGSKGHVSSDEEILEFPEDDTMDLDMDLDGMPDPDLVVPDVVVLDVVVPEVVVPVVVVPEVVMPDLGSNATVKVT